MVYPTSLYLFDWITIRNIVPDRSVVHLRYVQQLDIEVSFKELGSVG